MLCVERRLLRQIKIFDFKTLELPVILKKLPKSPLRLPLKLPLKVPP